MGMSAYRNRIATSRSHAGPVLIIFNPTAGRARRDRLARAVRALRAAGLQPELAETARGGDARHLAAMAAGRGTALVVAAGGDGTIAEVAGGIAGSGTALGLLPLGTANVLAQELGLPLAPEAAAAVLAGGRRAILYPGLARWPDGREALFVQMLGAGFDAAVVRDLDLGAKRRLGRLAYVLESLRQLRGYAFPPLAVALDGAPPRAAGSVIVSKGRFYAGRFRALPGASPLAPGFSVLSFAHGGPAAAALAGAALPLNLLHRVPGARLLRAALVEIGGAAPAQVDGDAAAASPLRVEDFPHPLPVIVP